MIGVYPYLRFEIDSTDFELEIQISNPGDPIDLFYRHNPVEFYRTLSNLQGLNFKLEKVRLEVSA